MSLFEEIKSRLPGLTGPTTSPQGWTDEVGDWPRELAGSPRALLRHAYASPTEAVDRVIEALEGLCLRAGDRFSRREASLALHSLVRSFSALQMEGGEVLRRRGSFGRLVHALVRYLPVLPWLLRKTVLAEAVKELEVALKGTGDAGLAGEADHLERACHEALEAMDFLLGPDLEETHHSAHSVPPATAPAAPGPAVLSASESRRASRSASRSGDRAPLFHGRTGASLPSQADPDQERDLTREKIYRCLLEECMKDGKLSAGEEESILIMRRTLGIPIHRHAAMVREVNAAFDKGLLEGDEEMKLPEFYERIYRLAMEDGVVTDDERHLLRTVAHLLGVTEAEISAAEARVNPGG